MRLTCNDIIRHQVNNYYPFGGILNESFNRVDYQNKLYNGKELDRMHGLNLYDYSARQYDPAIGQFTSMDPLCEKYYHISPYAYCAGNPVNAIDPNGCDTLNVSRNDKGEWGISSYRNGGDCDVYYIDGQDKPVVFDSNADISQLAIEITDDCTLSIINVKGQSTYGFAVTPSGHPENIVDSNAPVEMGIYPLVSNNNAKKWKCAGPYVSGYNLENGRYEDRGIRIHYAGNGPNDTRLVRASGWTNACSVVSSSYKLRDGKVLFNASESYAFYSKIQMELGGKPYGPNSTYKRYGYLFSNPINKHMQYKYRKLPM